MSAKLTAWCLKSNGDIFALSRGSGGGAGPRPRSWIQNAAQQFGWGPLDHERGVIRANPSHQPHPFDLQTLFPDDALRRLEAAAGQDPRVNCGPWSVPR